MNQENINILNDIRRFDTAKLAEVLTSNGFGECCKAIQARNLNGEQFLNLNEVQIKLWRDIKRPEGARLWSAIQQVKQFPDHFYTPPIKHSNISKNKYSNTTSIGTKTQIQNVPQSTTTKPKNNSTLYRLRQEHKIPPAVNDYTSSNAPRKKCDNEGGPTKYECMIKDNYLSPEVNGPKEVTLSRSKSGSNTSLNLQVNSLTYKPLTKTDKKTDTNPNSFRPLPQVPNSNTSANTGAGKKLAKPPIPGSTGTGAASIQNIALPRPPALDFLISLPSPTADSEEYVYDSTFTTYTYEPWYHQIDRKRARQKLENRPNGSFLIRPSSKEEFICVLSLIYNKKFYNLPVHKIDEYNLVLGTVQSTSKQFPSVKAIVEYYIENSMALIYEGREVLVKLCN